MNREKIYAALFAALQSSANFKTASRKLKHWADVEAIDQPALFQAQKTESASTVPGQPTVWMLYVDVYVYANTQGDPKIAPSQIINPLIDSIVVALAPNPIQNRCTLGGLVEFAVIDGAIQTDEGVLGDQAIAVIPVVLKVTS